MLPFKIDRPVVFFDLESTSANPKTARIVEIALVRFEPDGKRTDYSTLINPGIAIPPEATAIHGITDDDVLHSPRWESKAPALLRAFRGSDYGGYHVKFDLELLEHECRRVGVKTDLQVDDQAPRVVDALRLWQMKEPRSLTDAVARFAGGAHAEAHSAVADIDATLAVIAGQFAAWPDLPRDVAALDALQFPRPEGATSDGRLAKLADGRWSITFGKHRGSPLAQVDRGYLRWCLTELVLSKDTDALVREELAWIGARG